MARRVVAGFALLVDYLFASPSLLFLRMLAVTIGKKGGRGGFLLCLERGWRCCDLGKMDIRDPGHYGRRMLKYFLIFLINYSPGNYPKVFL